MILEELVLSNFGLYRGTQSVDLSPLTPQKRIVLFGGLNGAGKTTLVDALQLALYGNLALCSNRGTLSYEEYLQKSIHRSADQSEGASVQLQFRHIVDGESHTYRIHRSWAARGKRVKENVEVYCDGKHDSVLTEAWQEQVEEFIPVNVSHLFFFDGEKIETFANPDNSAQLLSTAVHSLLGLDVVDRLLTDLTVLERRKQSSLKSLSEQKQLERLNSQLAELENKFDALTQERGSLSTQLVSKQKTLDQTEARLKSAGSELIDKRHKIETKHAVALQQLTGLEDELREVAAGSAPLFLVARLLQDTQQQDLLEEKSAKDALMVQVLSERDSEVLKQATDIGMPSAALKTITKLLSDDRKKRSKLTSLSKFQTIGQEARSRLAQFFGSAKHLHGEIQQQIDKSEKFHNSVVTFERRLQSVPEDDALEDLTDRKNNALQAVNKIEYRLDKIDEELGKVTREKSALVNKIKRQLETEFEGDDSHRILDHSKKVRNTLENFRNQLILKNINKVESLILDSLSQLLRKKGLVSGIKIDPVSFAVRLTAADGKELSPERLSAGERQLLAAAMLWGLARAVGRPLPAVIDTPLGRLDSAHRNHLVERYFPNASHQVILLSTDEEISEAHFQRLKGYVGRSYRLDFNDKLSSTEINPGYFW